MKFIKSRSTNPLNKIALLLYAMAGILYTSCEEPVDKNRTWSIYKADAESTSSSPLKEINKENVNQLQIAWKFIPGDARGDARVGSSECNPIIIDGIMYLTSARHRVYAIKAATGEQLWSYDPFNGGEGGVVKQVQLLDSLGIDFLKAYEMLTPEQFQMIMTLAREKGLKVTGHVPLSMDIISASNAGLNSMEHMRNLELSCASNSDELLAQRKQLLEEGKNKPGGDLRTSIHKAQRETAIENYDEGKADKIIEVLSSNQTWQIPTMALATVLVNRPFKQSHWQESFTYLPDSIHQRWNADIESIMKTEVHSFNQKYATWMMNMVDKINKARIDIMAGTDTPIAFLTPGLSLHEELRVLVLCGLTPLEAIKTATYNPAKYFNMENELGSIKENMWADLVILDANPLEDINNTRQINAVVKQGKYCDRNDLDNKLKRLRDE